MSSLEIDPATLELVGYHHSHPVGPAAPSATDRTDAWPGVSYLMVSASGASAGEVPSWRLRAGGSFAEEEIRVQGEVRVESGVRS